MDKITQETTLLCKKRINTIGELDTFENDAKEKLDSLIKQRRCIYNKIRRCRNAELKEMHQRDVATLSAQIKELRKEVVLYEGIRERSSKINEKLKIIRDEEKNKMNKNVETCMNKSVNII